MKGITAAVAVFFIACASPPVRNGVDDIIENRPGLLPLALRFPADCGAGWKAMSRGNRSGEKNGM